MTETVTKHGSLEDSTFNIIAQLESLADFLYTSAEQYIHDAEKITTSDSQDVKHNKGGRSHTKMLREDLVRELRKIN